MHQVDATNAESVFDWIATARGRVHRCGWADCLVFRMPGGHETDIFDVLLSPIYLAVLNASRGDGVSHRATMKAWFDRARRWAYNVKTEFRDRRSARHSGQPEPTEILLWSRDITHTITLCPVMRALHDRGTRARLMACQAGVFDELLAYDPHTVFARAAWPDLIRRAHLEGVARVRRLATSGPWNLPPFRGMPGELLEPAVRHVIDLLLPSVSESVAVANAAVDAFKPKVLVVGNDITFEGRTASRIAAQRGVATATVMHGAISSDPLQAMHCVDRMFVNGPIHARELQRQGLAAERISICGAPNLDRRPRQTGTIHPTLRTRLGLRQGEPWILAATSGPGHRISHRHHQAVIENLSRLSAQMPHVPIVVKLHRKDRLEYYDQAMQQNPNRIILVREESVGFPRGIFEWLNGCPVVLTGASTVAVEAMLMDVPVISMDFCDEIHDVDFIDARATTHVRTYDELASAVEQVLTTSDAESRSRVAAYLKEAYTALDGGSSNRIAQALEEMASRSVVTDRPVQIQQGRA